ncbi:SMP-30/gluconolactonase/LRE family protein [Oceaniglobus trochenteri]|uniref:SMP-30/gluconolactonase/LRE family protein n=1 Tax=Oceaniglobus trochenteri TaxID=2763260 RepID=UPI001CFF7824|nr:SMP-30/gluconolactonase/LRE family protein [Oceaniglobus trochenteri]
MTNLRIQVPAGDFCGEGLIWTGSDLFWTDINRFLIHRHDPAGVSMDSWQFEEPVVALAQTEDPDELLVALGSKLIFWRPRHDERRDHGFCLQDYPRLRLNDGRAAPDGSFWVGSMFNNVQPDGQPGEVQAGQGALYAIRPGGVTKLLDGIGIPNTLCWSVDRTRFYFADTLSNDLACYAWDQGDYKLSRQHVLLAGDPRGLPDGSTIDEEGYIWNCRFGGGSVLRVSPEGAVDRVVKLPVSNVTTCAFGGDGNRTLFITTAAAPQGSFERHAGSLFALDTEVAGAAEYRVIARP